MKLNETELKYWGFFSPYASGTYPPSVDDPLDLTLEEVEEWLLLVKLMRVGSKTRTVNEPKTRAPEDEVDFVVRASKAYYAADYYFMPSDNEWRRYIYIDDLTDDEATKEALLDTGHALRDIGKRMPYYDTEERPKILLHGNFALRNDPALDSRVTTPARSFDLWSSPITSEQKARALMIDDISVLTAIVNSACLMALTVEDKWLGKVQWMRAHWVQEVPWHYINWRHVTKYVSDPWLLFPINAGMRLDRDKFMTDLEQGTKSRAAGIRVDIHAINAALMSPVAVGTGEPLPLYETDTSVDLKLWSQYGPGDSQITIHRESSDKKTQLHTLLPSPLQFYLGGLSYLATKPLTKQESSDYGRLAMCGLLPLLKGMSIEKYSKITGSSLSFLINVDTFSSHAFCSLMAFVPIVTIKALYRGELFEQDGKSYIRTPLDDKDLDGAVDYIIATLGSDAAIVMATVAVEHYMSESEDHRLLDFAVMVENKTNNRDVPASRLP